MAFIRGYANNFPHLMGRIGFGAGGPAQVKSINRRFQKLEDYTVKDSVANRDATLLAPVSKFNGVSSRSLAPITSGVKHVKMKFVFNGTIGRRYQVLFSSGTTSNYAWIAFYEGNSTIRFSGKVTNVKLYKDNVLVPGNKVDPNGVYFLEFNMDLTTHSTAFIGTTKGGEAFNGNIWDVEINSMKIPLPHIGVGFDENGDPVKLTNTDVEEDYVKGGSKWLLQHGMMYDRDTYKKDALDPSNVSKWNLGNNGKIEDGYLKLGFYNNPQTSVYFLDYYKDAIDSGGLTTKGNIVTRLKISKWSGDISIKASTIPGAITSPSDRDSSYLYFYTGDTGSYSPLAFYLQGTTGEIWIDEIVSYWETVAPNKEDGSPAYDASGEFDQVINGTTFLNKTPFAIDFHDTNSDQTPFEVSFFDKSNVSIWSSNIRSSKYYNNSNPFIWHSSELTQQFIYENVMDAYKYHLWSKLINEFTLFKDIFFYNTALSDNVEICKTKTYVRVGEKDDLIEGSDVFCKTDIIMP